MLPGGSFLTRSTARGCAILLGFLLGIALRSDDFLITDGVLSCTRDNHQAAALGAEFGHRFLPDSKVAGWVVAAAVKDALLLLGLTLYQVTMTYGTECTGFIDKRAAITTFREA